MIELFGEPQVHPQNMDDKYGQFAKNYFFIDRTRMDKIIGIKKIPRYINHWSARW